MPSSPSFFQATVLLLVLLLSLSFSNAKPSFRPRALVLPVSKDASTNQYLTHFKQRTPLTSISLVVDLGGIFLWVDCEQGYISSSYISPKCRSAPCSLAKSNGCGECYSGPKPGCNNNTCSMFPENSVNGPATSGELAIDVVALQSTNGKNPGPVVSIPRFIFTCGSTFLLEGLAKGVTGMAGLGKARIGMPSLLSAAFSLHRKFAICLPSSGKGVIFFGNGPYVDISASLMYTPLLTNPVSTAGTYSEGDPSYEYFIGVKSIKVNEKSIKVNETLLSINSEGRGGTKISTVNPYTVLESSIYKALTSAFAKGSRLSRVAAVAPFGFCFDSNKAGKTKAGAVVPNIDLVLQSESVYWRIYGVNSMVQMKEGVMCLGFVDGGLEPRTSIVIGGYQLENNLLQFDLATSRLGFSSSLLFKQTSCSHFNFTSAV